MSEEQPQELPSSADVVVSSSQLLVTLAARALAAGDLAEASLAIDAIAAQLPVLERVLPADAVSGFRQALTDLRLGYGEAASAAAEPPPEPAPRPPIWTPGGEV